MSSTPTATPSPANEQPEDGWLGFVAMIGSAIVFLIVYCVLSQIFKRHQRKEAKKQDAGRFVDGLEAYEVGRKMQGMNLDEMGFEMVDLNADDGKREGGKEGKEGKKEGKKGGVVTYPGVVYMGGGGGGGR